MLKVKASRSKEYITLPSKVMEKLALKSGDSVTIETRADEIIVKRRARKAKANGALKRAASSAPSIDESFDEWLKHIQATAVFPERRPAVPYDPNESFDEWLKKIQATAVFPNTVTMSKEEALAIIEKTYGGWENLDIEGPLEEMRQRFNEWKPPDWS